MRRLLVLLAVFALIVIPPFSRPAGAASTYYFHGNSTDQVDKQQTLADETYVLPKTFNQTPPTGTTPVTQTTTGLANEDYVGNPLTLYWHGPFTGTVSP